MRSIFTISFLFLFSFCQAQSTINFLIGENSSLCKSGMGTTTVIGASVTDDILGDPADLVYTFTNPSLNISPVSGTITHGSANSIITTSITAGAAPAGIYTVTLTTMQAGSSTIDATAIFTVTVNDVPAMTIETLDGTDICSDLGTTITLTAIPQANVTVNNYLWSTGEAGNSIMVNDIMAETATISVNGTNGCGMSTSTVVITEHTPPNIDTQPMDMEDCSQNTVTFSIAESGGTSTTFQWQRSIIGTFEDLVGETSTTLMVVADDANNPDGADYRVLVEGIGCPEIESNIAELTVSPTVNIIGNLNSFSLNPGVSITITRTIINTEMGATTTTWTVGTTDVTTNTTTNISVGGTNVDVTVNNTVNPTSVVAEITLTNNADDEVMDIPLSLTATGPCGEEMLSTTFTLLPVELLYFRGAVQREDILLNWATATEEQNDFFTIERSFDGVKFSPIGEVDGAGDSYSKVSYSFTDLEVIRLANSEHVYYRLMQTDFDGNSSYSEIVNIQLDEKAGLEIINIVQDGELLDLNFYSPENANIAVEIYDLKGLKVVSQEFLPFEGFNEMQLSTNGLPEGFYVISLNNGGNRVTKKFLKF